jgi:Co/Zn/Cd efflux system component
LQRPRQVRRLFQRVQARPLCGDRDQRHHVLDRDGRWHAFGITGAQADALDFLGDTATYAITLLVIGMALMWRARAALFKGLSLGAMGLWVLSSTAYQIMILGLPQAEVMGAIGFLALVANLSSVLILLRYREGDANVRSVWLCSRNDAIGNLAVVLAAAGVWASSMAWPDLIVAGIMASLFLYSSIGIVRQAMGELAPASLGRIGP